METPAAPKKTFRLQPLGNRLLVRRPEIDGDGRTESGLYIPDVAKEKPQEGIVCEIGADVKLVKQGDRILHGKFSGIEIKLAQDEFVIMREDEIFGILHKE